MLALRYFSHHSTSALTTSAPRSIHRKSNSTAIQVYKIRPRASRSSRSHSLLGFHSPSRQNRLCAPYRISLIRQRVPLRPTLPFVSLLSTTTPEHIVPPHCSFMRMREVALVLYTYDNNTVATSGICKCRDVRGGYEMDELET